MTVTQADKDLHVYNARDVLIQMKCSRALDRWMEDDGTHKQYEWDKRFFPYVRDMSSLGFFVHWPTRNVFKEILRDKREKSGSIIREIVGREDFNPNSSPQTADYLYNTLGLIVMDEDGEEADEIEEGSTNIKAVIALSDELTRMGIQQHHTSIRFLEELITYRTCTKLLGTYVDGKKVNRSWQIDPRLPPYYRRLWVNYNLHRVASGRLSTSGRPPMQTIPKRAYVPLRKMYCAPPGHKIVTADFGKGEIKCYAVQSKCQSLLEALRGGLDVHDMAYAEMVADSPSEVQGFYDRLQAMKKAKDPRYDSLRLIAKVHNFGRQYGGGDNTVLDIMRTARDKGTNERLFPDITRAKVEFWGKNYKRARPEQREFHGKILRELQENGCVASPDGRKRHFPNGPNKYDAPFNHVTQAWLAWFTTDAQMRIQDWLDKQPWKTEYTGVFEQTHDELGVYAPDERAEEVKSVMERSMRYDLGEGIILDAEAEISTFWSGDIYLKAARAIGRFVAV